MVDSYVLAFAGLLLAAGSLGDRFGRRGALVLGLSVFGVGSLAAALSGSVGQLVASRAVMGIGAAFLLPATLSILTNVYTDPVQRARAIATWAGVFAIGIAIGPVTGGWLLEHFAWGSVFLVNVPLVALTLLAIVRYVPTSKDPTASRLDVPGLVLSVVGLCLLVWAIIEAPERGWTSAPVLAGFLVAGLAAVAFVRWEQRVDEPMLQLGLFRDPRFSVASVCVALVYFGMFGAVFLLSQYLQFVRGLDALEAGLRYLALAIGMVVVAPLSARLVERFGTKVVVATGMSMVSASLLLGLTIEVGSGDGPILAGLLLLSAGAGLTMAPATESIMGAVPLGKAGVGSAMNDTTREVGGALGVAVLGSILSSTYRTDLAASVDGLPSAAAETAQGSLAGALSLADEVVAEAARQAFVDGMHAAFVVAAAIGAVAAAAVACWLPGRAAERSVVDDTVEPTREAA